MRKYEDWEFKEDMLNEKNIVPSDEFLTEESEVLENGQESS